MIAGVPDVAIAAAIAEAQRQEEEEMTGYSPQDLADGWEFKILRAPRAAFRTAQTLQVVLDEESRGGWILVEKFDDYRIRLKRPSGTKMVEGDFEDGYDPYRTMLGPSQGMMLAAAILIGVALLFGGLGLALLASR